MYSDFQSITFRLPFHLLGKSRQAVFWNPIGLPLRKGLPAEHRDVINDYILRQKENALASSYEFKIQILQNDVTATNFSPVKVAEKCPKSKAPRLIESEVRLLKCEKHEYEDKREIPLSLVHIEKAFVFYWSGIGAASAVFFLEFSFYGVFNA